MSRSLFRYLAALLPVFTLIGVAVTVAVTVIGARPSLAKSAAPAKCDAAALHPAIIERRAWGAAPAKFEMPKHTIRFITVHHTAVRQNPRKSVKRKLKGLQSFSQKTERLASGKMKKAWADVPYHYYIGVSGDIGEGRDVSFAGDTNTNYNPAGHIQVVVEGNFQKDRLTAPQRQALVKLLAWLSARYQIDPSTIEGHKHHAQTLCPGKNLDKDLPAIRKLVKAQLAQTCR